MVSNRYTTYFLLRKRDCVGNNAFLFLHNARSCHNIYHYTGYQQFLFPYYTSIEKVGGTTRPRRGTSSGVSGLLTLTRNRWWNCLCSGNLIPAHASIGGRQSTSPTVIYWATAARSVLYTLNII